MHLSNVMIVDPVTRAPVRVWWAFAENGERVRVTKGAQASGSILPSQRPGAKEKESSTTITGPLDTSTSEAMRVSLVTEGAGGPIRAILDLQDRRSLAVQPGVDGERP